MIGFDAALRRARRNLDISAAAVQLPFAEAAIDVDKVSDHQIVEQFMRRCMDFDKAI